MTNLKSNTLLSLVDEMFSDLLPEVRQIIIKNTNILEKDDKYEVQVFYPGIKKSDFDISFQNDILEIKVEKPKIELDGKYLVKTFDFRNIHEKYKFSKNINHEQIEASYQDGVLTIILPKDKEQKTKKINIQ